MRWFVGGLALVALVYVGWNETRDDDVAAGSYEIVEAEFYGTTVKLAKNAEYCEASWDVYWPIPEAAEWLGPQVYGLSMPDDPDVYKEIYLTDGNRGVRAAGTHSCWDP